MTPLATSPPATTTPKPSTLQHKFLWTGVQSWGQGTITGSQIFPFDLLHYTLYPTPSGTITLTVMFDIIYCPALWLYSGQQVPKKAEDDVELSSIIQGMYDIRGQALAASAHTAHTPAMSWLYLNTFQVCFISPRLSSAGTTVPGHLGRARATISREAAISASYVEDFRPNLGNGREECCLKSEKLETPSCQANNLKLTCQGGRGNFQ